METKVSVTAVVSDADSECSICVDPSVQNSTNTSRHQHKHIHKHHFLLKQKELPKLTIPLHSFDKVTPATNFEMDYFSAMSQARIFLTEIANRTDCSTIKTQTQTLTLPYKIGSYNVTKNTQTQAQLTGVPRNQLISNHRNQLYYSLADPLPLTDKLNALNKIISELYGSHPPLDYLFETGVVTALKIIACSFPLGSEQDEGIVTKSLLVVSFILSMCTPQQFTAAVDTDLIIRLLEFLSVAHHTAVKNDTILLCLWLIDKAALCGETMKYALINLGAMEAVLKIIHSKSEERQLPHVEQAFSTLASLTSSGVYSSYEPPLAIVNCEDSSDAIRSNKLSFATGDETHLNHSFTRYPQRTWQQDIDSLCNELYRPTCEAKNIFHCLSNLSEMITLHGSAAVEQILCANGILRMVNLLELAVQNYLQQAHQQVHARHQPPEDNVLTTLHVMLIHSNYSQFHCIVNETLLRVLLCILKSTRESTVELALSVLCTLSKDYHVVLFLLDARVITTIAEATATAGSALAALLTHQILTQLEPVCPSGADILTTLKRAVITVTATNQDLCAILWHCDRLGKSQTESQSILSLEYISKCLQGRLGVAFAQVLLEKGGGCKIIMELQLRENMVMGVHAENALTLLNSLCSVCTQTQQQTLLQQEGCIDVLLRLTTHTNCRVQYNTLWVLSVATNTSMDTGRILLHKGCLSTLLRCFDTVVDNVTLKLTGSILCHMVKRERCQMSSAEVRSVLQQLKQLMYNAYCGCNLTAQLCSAFEQLASCQTAAVVDEFFVCIEVPVCLIRVLTSTVSPSAHLSALTALSHLLFAGNVEQRGQLVHNNIQSALCALLNSPHEDIASLANRSLVHLQLAAVPNVGDLSTTRVPLKLPHPSVVLSAIEQLIEEQQQKCGYILPYALQATLNTLLSNLSVSEHSCFYDTPTIVQYILHQLKCTTTSVSELSKLFTILLSRASSGAPKELASQLLSSGVCLDLLRYVHSFDVTVAALACRCFANICECNGATAQFVLDAGALPVLLHVIESTPPQSPKHYYVSYAILFALQQADLQRTQFMIDGGVIPAALSLLPLNILIPEGHNLVLEALTALYVLLTKFEHLCDFEHVCEVVESFNGWFYVTHLRACLDVDIRAVALKLNVDTLRERYVEKTMKKETKQECVIEEKSEHELAHELGGGGDECAVQCSPTPQPAKKARQGESVQQDCIEIIDLC